jgi:hypothetical protein
MCNTRSLSYSWTYLFYSRLCYLDMSVLQKTVHGRVCSTADCATWTCLFYSRLSYPWSCLFYSRLCYPDVSVIKQSVLSLGIRHPGGCLTYSSLCCTWTCMSTKACSAPVHVYLQELCAAPWSVYQQELVVKLAKSAIISQKMFSSNIRHGYNTIMQKFDAEFESVEKRSKTITQKKC